MPFTATRQAIVSTITLNKSLINKTFRVLVVLLPVVALYTELSGKDNLDDITTAFWQQLGYANGWWLVGPILLIPFNWLAEVTKWRHFIVRFEPVSRRQAWNAILAGTSFALFTPNRVGEYGARVLFVRPENQWKALIANLVGNASQYLVLLTGGVWGGLWFAGHILKWSALWQFCAVAIAAVALTGAYYLYFNIRLLIPIVRSTPLLRRWEILFRDIHFLEQISRSDLVTVLAWSIFRYLVYSTQYVLLLRFFGIETGITAGFAGVATIYLLQTILPLPALAGLLVRGSLAVFVWSHFGANEVSSLSATFVLWIINLILPALIGTFSLFSVNITKSLGYEDD